MTTAAPEAKSPLPGTHLGLSAEDLAAIARGTVTPDIAARAQEALASLTDPRENAIRRIAEESFHRDGELEIDAGALLSEGDDNGTYLLAWRWVDFAGTPLDKEADWLSEVPGSADSWDLITENQPTAEEVAGKLSAHLCDVIRAALLRALAGATRQDAMAAAENEMITFMGGLACGAGDTEPRAIMARTIEAAFDEYPELGRGASAPRAGR